MDTIRLTVFLINWQLSTGIILFMHTVQSMMPSNISNQPGLFRAGLLVAVAIFCTASCTSEEALVRNWQERINLDVGHPLEQAINTRKFVSANHRSSEIDEYAFRDGKCRWTYFVNRKTGLIESWRYDTEPENCRASYCFFCSW